MARRAGLGYPGGPVVDRIAARGDGARFPLPVGRAGRRLGRLLLLGPEDRDAPRVREARRRRAPRSIPTRCPRDLVDLFASFQRAIVTALLERVETVHRREGIERLALSGGVAANSELRATLARVGRAATASPVLLPDRSLTTDNAAMIAWAGLLRYRAAALRAAGLDGRTRARAGRWENVAGRRW